MEEEYSYWEINFISCEGNKRFAIARAPIDWEEYDVRSRVTMGGCGDDVAELKEIIETYNDDYSWDYT
jgi:hypothetical protein